MGLSLQSLYENAVFIDLLWERIYRVRFLLGDRWPSFAACLHSLLTALEQADDERAESLLADIVDLGLDSPAAPVFRESLAEASAAKPPTWAVDMGPGGQALGSLRDNLDAAVGRLIMEIESSQEQATAVDGMQQDLETAARPPGAPGEPKTSARDVPGTEEGPPARYLNAGFFEQGSEKPVPDEQPLFLDAGPYCLGVNIGEFWGPGIPGDTPVGALLQPLFDGETELEVQVAVRSRTILVKPAWQTLPVPHDGNSATRFFDLTIGRGGHHTLDVDLFYKGHLLQTRHVEVEVLRRAGLSLPADRKPQRGWPTFSRASMLTKAGLAALEQRPRRLTITVQQEGGRISLRFYDWSQAEELGCEESSLTGHQLNTLLNRVRDTLLDVTTKYGDRIGGDLETFCLRLWQLADAGSRLYRELLPTQYDPDAAGPGAAVVELPLVLGQVIQVAPLSEQVGLPWELLYERPILSYRKERQGTVRLCPEWQSHAPDDCPNAADERVVCPWGFWGYRYILEQLPNRLNPADPLPVVDLPLWVRNSIPLHLAAMVYGFPNLESHLEGLRALEPQISRFDLSRVETLDAVEKLLTDPLTQVDILYFYAHGGFDKDEPALTLGSRDRPFILTAGDLKAWRDMDLTARQPLVVLNACESAAYRPDRVENLLQILVSKGASGVIGTQCRVPTGLADAFIRSFFRSFLGVKTVGEALYGARLALLHHQEDGVPRPDPRGLVYSLFAAADVKLGEPLLS